MRHTTALRLVGALLVAGLVASCAQVPHAGPVVQAKAGGQAPPPQGQYNNPRGPQPDATASDIESLGEEVRSRVFKKSGVLLKWEIRRIGEKKPVLSGAEG